MKKTYIQPNVVTEHVQSLSIMQSASPGGLSNSGQGTGDLGGDPPTGN